MRQITAFTPELAADCAKTHALLVRSGLWVHGAVERVTVHGSRGPQGGARPDSDLDLCLVVNAALLAAAPDREKLLRAVLETTLAHWESPVEIDLAAAFDRSQCGLLCLAEPRYKPGLCRSTVDCLGLYKIQKGVSGYVTGPGVDCSKMYPLMTVWSQAGHGPRSG
jgi:hypothetical protein